MLQVCYFLLAFLSVLVYIMFHVCLFLLLPLRVPWEAARDVWE